MTTYVFDTEPLIAYLYDEPGADAVTDRLRSVYADDSTGFISHATAVEIMYKVARLERGTPDHVPPSEDDLDVGKHDLRIFQGFGLGIETPSWAGVASIKASGGISLGDSYAVALAKERDGTLVVGADPEFDDLPVDVPIERVDAATDA